MDLVDGDRNVHFPSVNIHRRPIKSKLAINLKILGLYIGHLLEWSKHFFSFTVSFMWLHCILEEVTIYSHESMLQFFVLFIQPLAAWFFTGVFFYCLANAASLPKFWFSPGRKDNSLLNESQKKGSWSPPLVMLNGTWEEPKKTSQVHSLQQNCFLTEETKRHWIHFGNKKKLIAFPLNRIIFTGMPVLYGHFPQQIRIMES